VEPSRIRQSRSLRLHDVTIVVPRLGKSHRTRSGGTLSLRLSPRRAKSRSQEATSAKSLGPRSA
jgi:hypothetical protein